MRAWAALTLLLCAAQAEPPRGPEDGCVLSADPGDLDRITMTGVPELNRRLETERRSLEQLFGVQPELVLFTADAPRSAFTVIRDDGTAAVFLSVTRLRESWKGEQPTTTVAAVLAHQYAHVLQAKRGPVPEHSCEEHADLLAGWFLGTRDISALRVQDLDMALARRLFLPYGKFLETPSKPQNRRAATVRTGCLLYWQGIGLDLAYREGLDLDPPLTRRWPAKHVRSTPKPSESRGRTEPVAVVPTASAPAPPLEKEGRATARDSCAEKREGLCAACRGEKLFIPPHYITKERQVWIPPSQKQIWEADVSNIHGTVKGRGWITIEVPGHCETVKELVWVPFDYRELSCSCYRQ